MKTKTGGWMKTAAGFLLWGIVGWNTAQGEELMTLDLRAKAPNFSLGRHEDLKIPQPRNRNGLLTPVVIVCEQVPIRAEDGRVCYLTVNREQVSGNYAWWLGRLGQVSYSERVVRSVTQRLAVEKYQASLAMVDMRKRF